MTRLGYFLHFGNFQSQWQQLFCPKLSTLLGNFCKGVKIVHFSSEIIFGQLLQTFGDFLLITLYPELNASRIKWFWCKKKPETNVRTIVVIKWHLSSPWSLSTIVCCCLVVVVALLLLSPCCCCRLVVAFAQLSISETFVAVAASLL